MIFTEQGESTPVSIQFPNILLGFSPLLRTISQKKQAVYAACFFIF